MVLPLPVGILATDQVCLSGALMSGGAEDRADAAQHVQRRPEGPVREEAWSCGEWVQQAVWSQELQFGGREVRSTVVPQLGPRSERTDWSHRTRSFESTVSSVSEQECRVKGFVWRSWETWLGDSEHLEHLLLVHDETGQSSGGPGLGIQ